VKLSALTIPDFAYLLSREGIFLRADPFIIHVHSQLPGLAAPLHQLYSNYSLIQNREFADIHIRLLRCSGLHHRWKGTARLWLDDITPYPTFPEYNALPYLEWGINWCVATRAHQYLILHAGVVAKGSKAVLLPAWPGYGKSTLCAALSQRGWRLLSDEFGLVQPKDPTIVPFPRPVSLKNQSINIIRAFAPEAILGPIFVNTYKGNVAHLQAPAASVAHAAEMVQAGWIIFPEFRANAASLLTPLSKTQAFMQLSHHSFNYDRIGLRGFETVSDLIESCECYTFYYSDLEEAIAQLDALVAGKPPT